MDREILAVFFLVESDQVLRHEIFEGRISVFDEKWFPIVNHGHLDLIRRALGLINEVVPYGDFYKVCPDILSTSWVNC